MPIEDDLEYHISFPLPRNCTDTYLKKKDNEEDGLTGTASAPRLYNHSNYTEEFYLKNSKSLKVEPVVLLLGWFGAQDRYLAKYSDVYNKLGCIAIRYTAPPRNTFWRSAKAARIISQKLLRLLEETSLSNHPVVFHSFSNHGAYLYSSISKNLQASPHLSLNVKGCVFDSCPSPLRILSVSRATYRSLGGPPVVRFFISCAVAVCSCLKGLLYYFSWMVNGIAPLLSPWDLIEEPFHWPQLLIYSKDDDLVSYKDVELFAEKRKERKVQVFQCKFENSPHVAHLKYHPREYVEIVNEFLAHCLNKPQKD